jgi:hypothetical protein
MCGYEVVNASEERTIRAFLVKAVTRSSKFRDPTALQPSACPMLLLSYFHLRIDDILAKCLETDLLLLAQAESVLLIILELWACHCCLKTSGS